jgi:lipopolysaccharide/colanic/teichoic acid biosynthesis glycosyltransferase
MALIRRDAGILLAGDLFFLALSLWTALTLRSFSFPELQYYAEHIQAFIPVFALSLVVFFIAGFYEHQTLPVRRVIGARIIGAQIATTLIAAVLFFVLPLSIAPKTVLIIYMIVSVLFIGVWRLFIAFRLGYGKDRDPAVLVGKGPATSEVLNEVNNNSRYPFKFMEHIDPSHTTSLAQTIEAAIARGVRVVVLDTRDPQVKGALPSLYQAALAHVTFAEFVSFYTDIFDRVPLENVDDAWLLEYLPRSHRIYDLAKRAFDITLAAIGSVIALPFIGLAALVLLPTGTPFISHERVGKDGRPFHIFKLRTMLINDHGDPELQKKNRVTIVGKILRKTRIDELPQLINILRGELSFIGPRPELPPIAQVYEKEIPYYQFRHLITPGLSGWAQIRDTDAPRGPADILRTRRKLSYDLYYLSHRSFALDITIALKTIRSLLSFSGT